MRRAAVATLLFGGLIAIDQAIKALFLGGFGVEGACISLELAINKGVAFSMLAFLGEWLKYLQLLLLVGMGVYLAVQRALLVRYLYPAALIFAAGISNLADRFMHGGVVDYVYWHCGFEFAIFNLADVTIDAAVVWILILAYIDEKKSKKAGSLRKNKFK